MHGSIRLQGDIFKNVVSSAFFGNAFFFFFFFWEAFHSSERVPGSFLFGATTILFTLSGYTAKTKESFCFWFPMDLLTSPAELDGGFVHPFRPPPPRCANSKSMSLLKPGQARRGSKRTQDIPRSGSQGKVWG